MSSSSLMKAVTSQQPAYLESFMYPLEPMAEVSAHTDYFGSLAAPATIHDRGQRSKRSRNSISDRSKVALPSPVTMLAADINANLSVGKSSYIKTPRRSLISSFVSAQDTPVVKSVPPTKLDDNCDDNYDDDDDNDEVILCTPPSSVNASSPIHSLSIGLPSSASQPAISSPSFSPVSCHFGRKDETLPIFSSAFGSKNSQTKMPPPGLPFTRLTPFSSKSTSAKPVLNGYNWNLRRNTVTGTSFDSNTPSRMKRSVSQTMIKKSLPPPPKMTLPPVSVEDEDEFEQLAAASVFSLKASYNRCYDDAASLDITKRRKEQRSSSPLSDDIMCSPPQKFRRTHSMVESLSTSLFELGDAKEKTYDELPKLGNETIQKQCQVLPCFDEKGADALKRINSDTLSDILLGKYKDHYEELFIIDCRFPYEYNGGHVCGAINITVQDAIDKLLLSGSISERRSLVVFHCEFSARRAPRMALYLRSRDRQLNVARYPYLYYPELYILQGGYSAFFEKHKRHCVPQNYVGMNSEAHREDYKQQMQSSKKSFSRSKSYTEGFSNAASFGAVRLPTGPGSSKKLV